MRSADILVSDAGVVQVKGVSGHVYKCVEMGWGRRSCPGSGAGAGVMF